MKSSRLLYRSIANRSLYDPGSLLRLANQAANTNRKFGITGLLACSNRSFLQVLEGPSKFVNRVYGRIIQDQRHKEVELLSFQNSVKPEFDDWDMKLVKLDELDAAIQELFRAKYPYHDGHLQFTDDSVLMLSLLLDVKHAFKKDLH